MQIIAQNSVAAFYDCLFFFTRAHKKAIDFYRFICYTEKQKSVFSPALGEKERRTP